MAIGSGDRVLVFLNLSDVAWTIGVVFIPLAALFLIPLTAVVCKSDQQADET
jgi:hypothetical protein